MFVNQSTTAHFVHSQNIPRPQVSTIIWITASFCILKIFYVYILLNFGKLKKWFYVTMFLIFLMEAALQCVLYLKAKYAHWFITFLIVLNGAFAFWVYFSKHKAQISGAVSKCKEWYRMIWPLKEHDENLVDYLEDAFQFDNLTPPEYEGLEEIMARRRIVPQGEFSPRQLIMAFQGTRQLDREEIAETVV